MLANAEAKWAVLQAFNALINHIANGRLRETMACFSEDADVTLFGSELTDTSLGVEAIREHLAEIYARPYRVLFDLQPGKVSAYGNVAWVTAEGTLRLSTEDERRPYRLTAVMERRGGRWVWQLFSGSEPR
jgi:ketosteroid isomerase-like protein